MPSGEQQDPHEDSSVRPLCSEPNAEPPTSQRRPGKRRGHARRLSTHTGNINQIGRRGGVQYSLYRGVEHHSSVKLLPFIHITRINTQIPPFHAKNSDRRSLQTFTAPADHTDDPISLPHCDSFCMQPPCFAHPKYLKHVCVRHAERPEGAEKPWRQDLQ